jgi:hypothetical protein
MAASNAAAAGSSAPPIDTLRNIAERIDAATREVLSAHGAHRPVAAVTVDATKRARGELDALARAASLDGSAHDATFARKAHQVGKLLANLERAEAANADASLPALVARTDANRISRFAFGTGRGASCASALTMAPGDAIDTHLAAADAPGSTLWLRVAPPKRGYARLDTAATALDTEITLFGADCPKSDAEAIAHDDDSTGLAAAVAIAATQGMHYARVRNLGSGGHAVVRLETAGAFVGRITDERTGAPLPAIVETMTSDGFFGNSVYNDDTTGLYLLTADPGSYYVYAGDLYGYPPSYVAELYPDAPCGTPQSVDPTCDTADATLLALADGQQLAGIDLALNLGGRIAGTVRDATSGAPIPDATVLVYDSGGEVVSYFGNYTDSVGRYVLGGLLTGNYYVQVGGSHYGSQIFNHVACGGPTADQCDPLSGTPVSVVRNELTEDVDFDLPRAAHVVATASARDGSPLLFGWSLTLIEDGGTSYNVYYALTSQPIDAGPLPAGTYRAYASAMGSFSQIWNGIDCPGDCISLLGQATPIEIAVGAEADLSFSLLPAPIVSGTITDAATDTPLPNVSVDLVPVDETQPGGGYVFTDSAGRYTVIGAPPGSYWIWASDSTHRPTLYPDAPCSNASFDSCDTSAATAVTIAYGGANVTGADIAMPPDGSISGHVRVRTPPGMTLDPIAPNYDDIYVYDASGNYAGSATIDVNGAYTVIGLPGRTYYAISTGFGFDELYGGIDCNASCDPRNGLPIEVATGQNTAGVDFDPVPDDFVFGRVTGPGGAPVGGAAIDLWDATGDIHCGVGLTNADGYYAVNDAAHPCYGPNRLSTDVNPGTYVNEVYDGIACPDGSAWLGLCSVDDGADVYFPGTPTFVIADFSLVQPERIFDGGFDP